MTQINIGSNYTCVINDDTIIFDAPPNTHLIDNEGQGLS